MIGAAGFMAGPRVVALKPIPFDWQVHTFREHGMYTSQCMYRGQLWGEGFGDTKVEAELNLQHHLQHKIPD